MTQYFINLPSNPLLVDRIAQRAGSVLEVLQPGCRGAPIRGPVYGGWLARDGACAARTLVSEEASFEVIAAAGAWFLPDQVGAPDEALHQALQRHGIDATASRLEGPFAIAVYEHRTRQLHVITDVAGTLHVFAAQTPEGWMISTSSTWLAAMTTAGLDEVAVHEFVASGIVYEDRTLWSGVRKLGQAQIATFSPHGSMAARQYWDFADIAPERDDIDTSVDRLAQSLSGAARTIGRRYPRVLCDITGGYDSRATIAGFMMAGVSFAGTVSGPDESPDVSISRAIAARFAIPHHRAAPEMRFDDAELAAAVALTDGEYDAVEYARVAAIHREHSQLHDVSVNGSFGELARGYWWELLWPSIGARKPLDSAMLARRRFAAGSYDPSVFADRARLDFVAHMGEVIARINAPLQGMPNTTQMDHAYFGLRMQRWQGRIASSTSRIWPSVSPFAFRSVLEPMLEARASSRLRSLLIRTLLARHVPKLAEVPLESGYPSIPATISTLHRFWPVLPHYAGRVRAKLAPSLGLPTQAAPSAPRADVRGYSAASCETLFDCGLFATEGLRRFLAAKEGPADEGPSFRAQFSRLMTLAVAVSSVARARAASVAE